MISDMQKQIIVGSLVGLLICAATYIVLGGKREDIAGLDASIAKLEQEVEKARQIKSNYAKLKLEVDEQNKQLESLIQLMPTEMDRGELPIRLKKIADTAGMEQWSFVYNPISKKTTQTKEKEDVYYKIYPYTFEYKSGFHEFGRFASVVSGFEKMINITKFQLRKTNNNLYPVEISCTISAFVYDPSSAKQKQKAQVPVKSATPGKGESE